MVTSGWLVVGIEIRTAFIDLPSSFAFSRPNVLRPYKAATKETVYFPLAGLNVPYAQLNRRKGTGGQPGITSYYAVSSIETNPICPLLILARYVDHRSWMGHSKILGYLLNFSTAFAASGVLLSSFVKITCVLSEAVAVEAVEYLIFSCISTVVVLFVPPLSATFVCFFWRSDYHWYSGVSCKLQVGRRFKLSTNPFQVLYAGQFHYW